MRMWTVAKRRHLPMCLAGLYGKWLKSHLWECGECESLLVQTNDAEQIYHALVEDDAFISKKKYTTTSRLFQPSSLLKDCICKCEGVVDKIPPKAWAKKKKPSGEAEDDAQGQWCVRRSPPHSPCPLKGHREGGLKQVRHVQDGGRPQSSQPSFTQEKKKHHHSTAETDVLYQLSTVKINLTI